MGAAYLRRSTQIAPEETGAMDKVPIITPAGIVELPPPELWIGGFTGYAHWR
jgi:hypothetical protein